MSLLIEGENFAICLDSICGVILNRGSNNHKLNLLLKNDKEPFIVGFDSKESAFKAFKEIRDALRQGKGNLLLNKLHFL
jgi:hypothetical protein